MTPKFVGPTATRDSGTCDHLAFPRGKSDGNQTVVMFKRGFLLHTHFLGQEEMGEAAQKETKRRTKPRSHQTGRQEHTEAERTGRAVPRTTDPNGGRQTPPTDTASASPAAGSLPDRRHSGGEEGASSSHSPPTSPGVCSQTPRSGRWIPLGNLGEGGDRSASAKAGPELTAPPGPPGGPVSVAGSSRSP